LAGKADIKRQSQAIHGIGHAHVQAGDQALHRVRVGDRLDDRAHGDERITFEIQLGNQARGNRGATDGDMDMRRAPIVGTVAPWVGAGLNGWENVVALPVCQRPAKAAKMGVEGGQVRGFLCDGRQRLCFGDDVGPDAGNEWDRRKRVWAGFTSSAFWVAVDQTGEIVACTLPWAPTQAKRLRVNRLGRWASLGFKLLSVVGAKTPEIGKPFTTLYLTHLTFLPSVSRETRAALIAAFIDAIFRQNQNRDFHMLSYADPDQLRKLAPLENYFAQTTPAEVYLVTTTPGRPDVPPNDGVVFEMAIV